MAIELKGTLEFDETNQILTYKDTTGVDNLANSTKYSNGNTNTNRLLSAVDHIDLKLVNPDYQNSSLTILSADLNNFYVNGKTLLSGNFLYSNGFNVGIYKLKAYVWFLIETSNSNNCTLTSLNVINATFSGNNFTSIRNGFADTSITKVVQGSNSKITTVNSFTTNNVTLSENLPNTFILNQTNVKVYAGYEIDLYALSDYEFLKCFQPKIAKTSIKEEDCCPRCKTDDVSTLNSLFLGLFSVYAQFESELYTDANSNIKTLLKICNSDGCKC
jgi:hypothetical protein